MPRRILVVHESQFQRKVVFSYLLSEVADVELDMVETPAAALDLLNQIKYEAVISGFEMREIDGISLHHRMLRTSLNNDTPFIIMTQLENESKRSKVIQSGIRFILPIPYSVSDLINILETATNPRQHRVYKRYSIPGVEVILHYPGMDVSGVALNISLGGVLCELTCPGDYTVIMKPALVDIHFPADYDHLRIRGILSSILRMTVSSWGKGYVPEVVRIARKFVEIREPALTELQLVLDRAEQELTPAPGKPREK